MRDLYEISVSINELDDDCPGHVELTVEPAFDSNNQEEFGSPSFDRVAVALRHLAGVLARLAVCLQTYVDQERQEHGCKPWLDVMATPPYWTDGCALSVPEAAMLRPERDWGMPTGVWITIPAKRRKYWLDLIAETLDVLAEPARPNQ